MEIGKLISWNHVLEVGEVLISGEAAWGISNSRYQIHYPIVERAKSHIPLGAIYIRQNTVS